VAEGGRAPSSQFSTDELDAMRAIPISQFIEKLRSVPEEEFTTGAMYRFLEDHPVDESSLEPYLFFSPKGYTRNLICKTDLFELLALCWDVGQVSRIHNHCGQLCWMTAPMGRLRIQNFRVLDQNELKDYCRLEPTDNFEIHKLLPAAVDPTEPVHQVMNLTRFNHRAVSLHVYSKPYNRCLVYSPATSQYQEVQLHNTSEYGRLCPGVKL
jgi:cysteine dioxygenase